MFVLGLQLKTSTVSALDLHRTTIYCVCARVTPYNHLLSALDVHRTTIICSYPHTLSMSEINRYMYINFKTSTLSNIAHYDDVLCLTSWVLAHFLKLMQLDGLELFTEAAYISSIFSRLYGNVCFHLENIRCNNIIRQRITQLLMCSEAPGDSFSSVQKGVVCGMWGGESFSRHVIYYDDFCHRVARIFVLTFTSILQARYFLRLV